MATVVVCQTPTPPPSAVPPASRTSKPAGETKRMARVENGAFPEDQAPSPKPAAEGKPLTNSDLLEKLTDRGLVRVKAQYLLPDEKEVIDRWSKGNETFATWRRAAAEWGRIVEARSNIADLQARSLVWNKEVENASITLNQINQEYRNSRISGRRSDLEQMRTECNDIISRDRRLLSQADTTMRGLFQQLGNPQQQNEAEANHKATSDEASNSLTELREMIDKVRAEYNTLKKELNPAIINYNRQFKPAISLGPSATFERVARDVRTTELEVARPLRKAKR